MRLGIESDLLDALVPLHLLFDASGRVVHAGPTFERIAPGARGRALDAVVAVRHPSAMGLAEAMLARPGRRLVLELKGERRVPPGGRATRMRGVVYRATEELGLLVLFFGADLAAGVARHDLTERDLARFDLSVEVLFLLEARHAVLSEHARTGSRLREAHAVASRQAVTDKLTGLHNRRAMDRRLAELSGGGEAPFGLMHLDLDYFKIINDRHGHAAGDRVLSRVGDILRREVRQGDMVARVGGDEFMILLEECDDLELMQRVARRIIDGLEAPFLVEDVECRISGSIGITLSGFYDAPEPERMIGDLDSALYASKHEGRARFSVARPGMARADPRSA